ncbi:hypothetical protein Tco_1019939 [Tanacetum coccineum]|uniref:Biogenesis of lysosome-related organelles complex 1 subunit 3 n=1 Tax=Tanacetum coccineum TaxID=301880 RepID=A0ABQ5FZ12_9ASTR
MAEPISPDHVFNFPGDDLALDIEDDPEMDIDEDPEMDIPHVVALPIRSPPLSPPPLSEASSDSNNTAATTAFRTLWIPPILHREHAIKSLRHDTEELHGSVRTLTRGMETRRTEIATAWSGINRVRRRMYSFDVDISFIEHATNRVELDVIALQARTEATKASLLQVE